MQLSISISIPDFDKISTEIECPICRLETWVTMGEIKRKEIVICRGCHRNILLEDYLASVHSTLERITHQLKNLG